MPKQDTEKAPLAELPWLALTLVAHAIRLGRAANGYEQHAWRKQPIELGRLLSAALRHIAAFLGGRDFDGTGAHHLAAAAFNVLAALELHASCAGVDDRLERGDAPRCPDLSNVTPEAPAAARPRMPEPIEGASAGIAYNLSPSQMQAVRALRVCSEETIGRRPQIPTEWETLDLGDATVYGMKCKTTESPLFISFFQADNEATRDALQALGLYGKQWASWDIRAAAEAATWEALQRSLRERREAFEAAQRKALNSEACDRRLKEAQ